MVLISINKASKCWVSSREKQKRRKTTNQQNTLHLQDQRGQQLQVSRSGLRSQIRSIQVSIYGLRSQMRSLQVSIFWIEFSNMVAPRPNILAWDFKYGRSTSQYSGLRSQIWSLQVLRSGLFFFEISNYWRAWNILRIQFLGTSWNDSLNCEFSFWELHRTSSLNCEFLGNFIEQFCELRVHFWELHGTSSLNCEFSFWELHGTSSLKFGFWELHGTFLWGCMSSFFGNSMGTFPNLGTSWEHLLSLESC